MMVRFRMIAVLTLLAGAAWSPSDDPRPMTPEAFDALHRMIKPQAGESLWMQIPWLTSVWEARKKAAAEGKPIFIWAGSGGGPVGVC